MKFKGSTVLFALMLLLVMVGSALAQEKEKPFLWNGNQWPQLPFDAKVGYVKGVGNMADFETAVNKSKGDYVARAFANELKTKSVSQIIEEIDKFYKENPGKFRDLGAGSHRRALHQVLPSRDERGCEIAMKRTSYNHVGGGIAGWLFRDVLH